jgi:general secretion pathway protein F
MRYQIKALDSSRNICVSAIDALDAGDARRQLAERGLRVISISRDLRPSFKRGRKFPIVIFSQELIALLDAGLSLVEAIDALTEKETNASMRRSLEQIRSRLFEGRSLSFALEELPATFPPLYVASVRASEKTGAIREALARYVAYQLQLDALRKKVVSASIYPAVLVGAGMLVTLFLLVYVVPSFSSIYEELGNDIPAASRALMQWGRLLKEHGAAVGLTALAIAALLPYALSRPRARAAAAAALTRIPAVGRQLFTYQLARLYRTVGMLLRGGMPAVQALRMSTGLLSEALRPRLVRAIQAISEGQPLASSLEAMALTTPVAARMLRVGQRSGSMGEMMERIASFYDGELERAVDVLTRLVEPILMMIIGLVIGVIVVLMYFPIFELAGSIQ